MIVLSPQFVGRILICNNCGAVLAYNDQDIYGKNILYCPICKHQHFLDYDKEYNGIITEEKKDVV